jgi:hypothetical protein
MAKELLSVLRFAVVAALPGGATKGDACVLTADGHLYVFDGSAWVDHGATGGGSSGPAGVSQAVVDFGATAYPSRVFDISDSLAATSQNVLASIATDADSEFEMTPLAVAAFVPVNGTIRVIVAAPPPASFVSGLVRVNYLLGNTPVSETEIVEVGAGQFDSFDPGSARILVFTSGAASLTGIRAPGPGQPRVLHVACEPTLTIYGETDALSIALASPLVDQFALGVYEPFTAIRGATFFYDSTAQRWRPGGAFS